MQRDELKQALKKYFGFETFRGLQEDIILSIMEGNDTFVLMPTGGGKSLCYQLPALLKEGTAIVISPLIALMKNQVDVLRALSPDTGVAHFLNSSLSKDAVLRVKEDLTGGKTKILYMAPESLAKEGNSQFLQSIPISFFAIDEAHCISEWGHDFRPEYRQLRSMIERIEGDVPVVTLTATATPKVQMDIQKNLKMQKAKVFKSSFNRSNLYYEVRPKQDVNKQLLQIIQKHKGKSGIIYCLSRKKVNELAETLQLNGIKALPYHAGLEAAVRSQNQDQFLKEDVDVIVATIAFGMGIDKPDIRFVIHISIPKSLEGYYQETGRAGRDSGEGQCIAFYSYKDMQRLETFLQGKPISEQEIGRQLLLDATSYAETALCRRKILLHYFGEEFTQENCGNCDNCLYPPKQFDGQQELLLALQLIAEVNEKFKAEHLTSVLLSEQNTIISSYKHDKLSFFGKGKDKDANFWKAIFRQAMIYNFIIKSIEDYGLLKLTEKGREFMKNPYPIMFAEYRNYDINEERNGGATISSFDPNLLNLLKALRKKVADTHNLPPYIVFQDTSLEDMALQYPITLDELATIHHVSKGKAERYGKEFVELILQYVEENDIERPQDMVVKQAAKRSKSKIDIIRSVDKRLSLFDVSRALGLEFEELLSELEAIVTSGTRIDIRYFVEQEVDDSQIDDLYSYLREESEVSLTGMFQEFCPDGFTEEHIRLVRIMFLSEMGN